LSTGGETYSGVREPEDVDLLWLELECVDGVGPTDLIGVLDLTRGSADKASPWIPMPPEISVPLYVHPTVIEMKVDKITRQTNTFKGFVITIPFLLD
jgi:hypothetical protein